jgi:5-methylcytosine-specific restriction endonuclease McrA
VSRCRGQTAGRVGRPWRTIQAVVFREETHCWLCSDWVDQTLPPGTPWSRSADHLIQLQHGGPGNSRANCRLAHIRCNTARSNTLRGLAAEDCACSLGLPCTALEPRKRSSLVVDAGLV